MPLHPDFPVVEGHYPLTPDWAITLDAPYNRRIEDGDLVLWNERVTVWMTIWHNDGGASIEARLDDVRQHQSPEAHNIEQSQIGDIRFYAYRLAEEVDDPDDARRPGYYGHAFAEDSQVQMAVYFDDEEDLAVARALHQSLVHTGGGDAAE